MLRDPRRRSRRARCAQVFELHAPACAVCADADAEWPAYATAGECTAAHALPHLATHYEKW